MMNLAKEYSYFMLNQDNKFFHKQKKFENPFFKKKRNFFLLRFFSFFLGKFKFILFLILILILSTIWFSFYSSYFNIKNINIGGLSRINKEEIESIVLRQARSKKFFITKQSNIFIFDEKMLIEKMEKDYCFDMIEIKKILPDTIKIDFLEKPYVFIWNESDKFFYSDKDGGIIEEVSPLDIKEKKYPLIYNQGSFTKIHDKKIKIDEIYISYALEVFRSFKNQEIIEAEIERLIIDDDVNTIKIKFDIGPTIYFNINENISKQINKLILVKNNQLTENFFQKEYVDLRYGDKIYYR